MHRRFSLVLAAIAAAVVLPLAAGLSTPSVAAPNVAASNVAAPQEPLPAAATMTNPVSASFADTYADPAVILGKDGWWYAYATADPLRAGDAPGIGHITRTKDFLTWDYLGPIFTQANRPSWATPTAGLWAPDIRYLQGRYVMYFTVTDTTANPGTDYAIGVATSDAPSGPFTPSDAPIVAPRGNGPGDYFNTIDPAGFTDLSGQNYLYFGGFYGGISVVPVSADGLRATGAATLVGHGDRYEGAYVVERDGWYYLMASSANCCSGPSTGYTVFAGRSRSAQGPFVDQQGLRMDASVTGGTTVVTQNGNTWNGVGHNAMLTDATGRDFLVYHGVDHRDPWLSTTFGINKRPMLIDPIDWIDGWPRVRAGAGPSDTPQAPPVTQSALGGDPADPAGSLTRAARGSDPQGGAVAVLKGLAASRVPAPGGAVRVRVDLRASAPISLTLGTGAAIVTVDPKRQTLTATTAAGVTAQALRATAGWQTLIVTVDGADVLAEVSSSDLADPAARVRATLGKPLASAPLRFNGNGLLDNLNVGPLAVQARQMVPVPQPQEVLFRDDFSAGLDPTWTWLRQQSDATVTNGVLHWPVGGTDLVGSANNAPTLLREAPSGDWVMQAKLTLPLGADTVRNYQQAGLIVHRTDDDFARLGSVAIWGTRTVEYGRELAAAPGAGTIYGGAIIGASAETMWMRIAHSTNAIGEHVYRAGISRNGTDWIWGAAWTFPAGPDPRIGLYAGGGASPAVTATFDDVTISRADVPATP